MDSRAFLFTRQFEVNLGYNSGCGPGTRAADVWWCAQYVRGVCLEFGAWPANSWIKIGTLVSSLRVTDSFEWLDNRFPDSLPRNTYMKAIREAGHQADSLDIQRLTEVEQYDSIYSISVMEHVLDDVQAFKNIHRALKPGGVFTFTCDVNPYVSMPYNKSIMFRVYKYADLVDRLAQAGFSLGELEIPDQTDYEVLNLATPENLRVPYRYFRPAGITVYKD